MIKEVLFEVADGLGRGHIGSDVGVEQAEEETCGDVLFLEDDFEPLHISFDKGYQFVAAETLFCDKFDALQDHWHMVIDI